MPVMLRDRPTQPVQGLSRHGAYMSGDTLKTTPLDGLHRALGARMVPFAGYAMPVQYRDGIVAEHLHVREKAGLFDVSHMGQAFLDPLRDGDDAATALERLAPGALATLKPDRMRYTMLLNEAGGILDDFMAARPAGGDGRLFLVVNAATKDDDFALMADRLGGETRLTRLDDRALLALQGPKAVAALASLIPGVGDLAFMQIGDFMWENAALMISRAGYTGEDGVEISVPGDRAEALAQALLDHDDVAPIGLGARDSLRLEAGLCLYGHDIDGETTPVEAGLLFAIPKSRRTRADFPGAAHILQQIETGPDRRRVGLKLDGRGIAREGAAIFDASGATEIGRVTSGTHSPCLEGPIAMGYVAAGHATTGTQLAIAVRKTMTSAEVVDMPFTPHRYKRG